MITQEAHATQRVRCGRSSGALEKPPSRVPIGRRLEATIESLERGLCMIGEINKRWDERWSFDRPDLLKRYFDRRNHFYLKLRAWSSPQGRLDRQVA
jgi:hypothetical protein